MKQMITKLKTKLPQYLGMMQILTDIFAITVYLLVNKTTCTFSFAKDVSSQPWSQIFIFHAMLYLFLCIISITVAS